ncbi:YcxB family protein [Hymenobacter sp. DG25B]|uniref:YcxB family protein n=1 Tax=Hymenobacter sp. DG25B TaxID=1385664 RepID=UPI000662ACFE|nr:YcxB family protein [Hymenobacter sp. DG25B]
MQQPNQRGFRQAQGASPLAIRTKKSQLDSNTYVRMALTEVWKKEWWYALIPLVVVLLPAIFVFSWWWVVAAVLVTVLFVVLRSAQVQALAQMEQSKALFERVNYEIDQRQILMRLNDKQGMNIPWEMIEKVRQQDGAYQLYLKAPANADMPTGWKGWVARTFTVPMFLYLPSRIFNSPNDLKLFESMLRRKSLLAAEAKPAA